MLLLVLLLHIAKICMNKLTVLSVIGGNTTVFSNILMTIFHNSFRSLLSTVFSQDWAYKDSEPSSRSIKGLKTSSASTATAFLCAGWLSWPG